MPGRASLGWGSDFGVSEDFCRLAAGDSRNRQKKKRQASGHVTQTAIIGWSLLRRGGVSAFKCGGVVRANKGVASVLRRPSLYRAC